MKCPTCNGKGEATVSCCTGQVVIGDWQICPVCKEHLGDEECPDCGGTGEVDENVELSPTIDPQLQAEIYNSIKEENG